MAKYYWEKDESYHHVLTISKQWADGTVELTDEEYRQYIEAEEKYWQAIDMLKKRIKEQSG
jgi:hypothetical protein